MGQEGQKYPWILSVYVNLIIIKTVTIANSSCDIDINVNMFVWNSFYKICIIKSWSMIISMYS